SCASTEVHSTSRIYWLSTSIHFCNEWLMYPSVEDIYCTATLKSTSNIFDLPGFTFNMATSNIIAFSSFSKQNQSCRPVHFGYLYVVALLKVSNETLYIVLVPFRPVLLRKHIVNQIETTGF